MDYIVNKRSGFVFIELSHGNINKCARYNALVNH